MAFIAAACGDEVVTSTTDSDDVNAAVQAQQAISAEQLARLVAEALQDPMIRQMLDRALDNSPVVENKLHLRTYFRGAGEQLASEMARSGNVGANDIARLMKTLGSLEIYMPVPEHRRVWEGGDDLIVAVQMIEHEVPFGVDLDGEVIALTLDHPPEIPTLSIVPAESFDRSGEPLQRFIQFGASEGEAGLGTGAGTLECSGEFCIPTCPPEEWEQCDGGGGGGGGGGGDGDNEGDPRGIGVREWISHMRTVNDHEPWNRGAPEFILRVVGTSDTDPDTELTKSLGITECTWNGSDDAENADWNLYCPDPLKFIDWDVDYGTRVKVSCMESDDNVANVQLNVSGSTVIAGVTVGFSATFMVEDSDDNCHSTNILARTSTGEWIDIPTRDNYEGTSDLHWYGFGTEL